MIPAAVSPHPLATQAALELLRRGASATEATVALAAVLSVVWPNVAGLGGDAFFLMFDGGEVKALNACGFSGAQMELRENVSAAPHASGSILTVPGAVAGWQSLLDGFPLSQDLLGAAIRLAEEGAPIDPFLRRSLRAVWEPAWRAVMAHRDESVFRQPELARTLWMMAGGHDFYCSEISLALCETLAQANVPITVEDFHFQHATWEKAVSTPFFGDKIWAPMSDGNGLAPHQLLELARENPPARERVLAATKNGAEFKPWCGAAFSVVDENGCGISAMQSLYREWGSGLWCPRTGILLHDRAGAFASDRLHPGALGPRRRPLNTLVPMLATHDRQLEILCGAEQPPVTAQVLAGLFASGKASREVVEAWRWNYAPAGASTAMVLETEQSDHDFFGHCNLIDLRGRQPSAVTDWRIG